VKPFSQAQLQTATRIQQLLGSGARNDALKQAEHLAQQATATPDAQLLLAICRAETGDYPGAEQAFRSALALAPEHPLILTNFGAMLRRAGKPSEAMTIYRRATQRAGNMAAAWLGLGRSARECNRPEEARSALQRHLELEPGSALGWHEMGRTERALENYEGARDAFAEAARLAPGEGRHEVNRGVCERLIGRPEEALACFFRAGEKGLVEPELDNARIGALMDCGRSEEAVAATRALLDQYPDFVPGYDTMADVYWEYGQNHGIEEDPAEIFRRRLSQNPDNRDLRLAFANFLLKARRSDEAIEMFHELRQQSDTPMLTTLQANAHEQAGQHEEAGALYRRAHGLLGDSRADFLCAYTRHLLRAGDWREAEQRAQAAVRVAPLDQEAWAYLGTAWRLLGDEREFWLCDYERAITFLEVPPPDGYSDSEAFIEALRAYLETLHRASREPIQQSLRHGSQTAGRLFGRPQAVIADTQQALTETIESWLGGLPQDQTHPFYQRNTGRIRYTGSWSVKLWKSGKHVNHIHSEGWISSAFYVALPPSVTSHDGEEEVSGCIHFGQPPTELELNLAPRRLIRPKVGHLALFPSYMWHGTVPFDDDEARMTIAFDMRARPKQ
jgi:tetratricopeptide (TPR) repeat protein